MQRGQTSKSQNRRLEASSNEAFEMTDTDHGHGRR
jgi:hypothetical protein